MSDIGGERHRKRTSKGSKEEKDDDEGLCLGVTHRAPSTTARPTRSSPTLAAAAGQPLSGRVSPWLPTPANKGSKNSWHSAPEQTAHRQGGKRDQSKTRRASVGLQRGRKGHSKVGRCCWIGKVLMPDISLIQRFCNQAFVTVVLKKKSYKRLYWCPRLYLGEKKVEKCVIVWTMWLPMFLFVLKILSIRIFLGFVRCLKFQSLVWGVLEQLLLLWESFLCYFSCARKKFKTFFFCRNSTSRFLSDRSLNIVRSLVH